MMRTTETNPEAVETLAAVVRLRCQRTDRAFEQAQGKPRSFLPTLGLGAQLVAAGLRATRPSRPSRRSGTAR